jgi:hypothetical protein
MYSQDENGRCIVSRSSDSQSGWVATYSLGSGSTRSQPGSIRRQQGATGPTDNTRKEKEMGEMSGNQQTFEIARVVL